mgnify:FL=1
MTTPIIDRDPGDETTCPRCGKPDNNRIFNEKAPMWMRMHACICVPEPEWVGIDRERELLD